MRARAQVARPWLLVNSPAFLAPQTQDFQGQVCSLEFRGSWEPWRRELPGPTPQPLPTRPASGGGTAGGRAPRSRRARPGPGARRPAGSLGMREVSELRGPVEPRLLYAGLGVPGAHVHRTLGSEPRVLAQRPGAPYNPRPPRQEPFGGPWELQPPSVCLEFRQLSVRQWGRVETSGALQIKRSGRRNWKVNVWRAMRWFFSSCLGCFPSPVSCNEVALGPQIYGPKRFYFCLPLGTC